jgi:Mg-chelatase subunit ChlI
MRRLEFPFSAIVDQELMKMALVLNLINDEIKGVNLRGERGTAKSVAVRGLSELVDELYVIKGCPFNFCSAGLDEPTCDTFSGHPFKTVACEKCPYQPQLTRAINQYTSTGRLSPDHHKILKSYLAMSEESGDRALIEGLLAKRKRSEVRRKREIITMPIGITEPQLLGDTDIEKLLYERKKYFKPGILARANRMILYVDEVNVLPDHIQDDMLDALPRGVLKVEREGVSAEHPASCIFIGSMNPREGELRPQLADRFDIHLDIYTIKDVERSAEVASRVLEFRKDPQAFRAKYAHAQEDLSQRIKRARQLLPRIRLEAHHHRFISQIKNDLNTEGERGAIAAAEVARAYAAYQGRDSIGLDDLRMGALLALLHRSRKLKANLRSENPEAKARAMREFTEMLYRRAKEYEREGLFQESDVTAMERLKEEVKAEAKKGRQAEPSKIQGMVTRGAKIKIEGKKKGHVHVDKIRQIVVKDKAPRFHLRLPWAPHRIFSGTMVIYREFPKRVKSAYELKLKHRLKLPRKFTMPWSGQPPRWKSSTSRTPDPASMGHKVPVGVGTRFYRVKDAVVKLFTPRRETVYLASTPPPRRKQIGLVGRRGFNAFMRERKGRITKWKWPREGVGDIHLYQTIKNAAYESAQLRIERRHLRECIREYPGKIWVHLVVDGSGSMALREEYLRGLKKFHDTFLVPYRCVYNLYVPKGNSCYKLLDRCRDPSMLFEVLKKVGREGLSPLSKGLKMPYDEIRRSGRKDLIPIIVYFTDTLANVPLSWDERDEIGPIPDYYIEKEKRRSMVYYYHAMMGKELLLDELLHLAYKCAENRPYPIPIYSIILPVRTEIGDAYGAFVEMSRISGGKCYLCKDLISGRERFTLN